MTAGPGACSRGSSTVWDCCSSLVIVVLTRGNDSVNRLLPPDGDKPTPASQCATLVCAYDRTALCFAAFGHITSQERRCRLTLGHARCERKVYAALVIGAQWRKA